MCDEGGGFAATMARAHVTFLSEAWDCANTMGLDDEDLAEVRSSIAGALECFAGIVVESF